MLFSNKEKEQLELNSEKERCQKLMHTDDYYKWLPVAMKHMARTTFDQRVRSGFGSIEKCATEPVNVNKSRARKGKTLPISDLCDKYEIPRTSFYKWRKAQAQASYIASLKHETQIKMYLKAREKKNGKAL